MAQGTCSIEGCDKPTKARGWCGKHYHRWLRHGDPNYPNRGPLIDRFMRRVEVNANGCWLWTASIHKGYGQFYGENRRTQRAHRWHYEYVHGPLPATLTVDHLCHNADESCAGGPTCLHRRCVNPDHLEAVPMLVNSARGKAPWAINARKTHCPRGHAYDIIRPDGRRWCRVCLKARDRAASARYRERKAQAKSSNG